MAVDTAGRAPVWARDGPTATDRDVATRRCGARDALGVRLTSDDAAGLGAGS